MPQQKALHLIFLLITTIPSIFGHGRLIEPPSRASAWRYGFSTPPNYNDHELYCGGFARQWQRNGGQCGVCGDPWDLPQPRPHEIGGAYGQGMIVRKYAPRGTITIRVELTANHFGFFEFRICENWKNTTQNCLDKNLLKLVSYKNRIGRIDQEMGYRFFPKDGNKIYEMRYRLPNITCTHCVLQWIYIASNNWGTCPNGTEAIGCGPQEQFRACADISITHSQISLPEIPEITTPILTTTTTPSTQPSTYTTTLFITLAALLLVLFVLAVLYAYYYKLGTKIKNWLKIGKKDVGKIPPPPKGKAPLPPPRARRPNQMCSNYNKEQMYNISFDEESLA